MNLLEVAAALALIITAIGISTSLIIRSMKDKKKIVEEDTKLDAATSLHRDLNALRMQRFGRPMTPPTRAWGTKKFDSQNTDS